MDYFRLERYGPLDPGPTKEIELDDFDTPSLDPDWMWYVPKEGPSHSLSAVNGAFRMILPELDWFNQDICCDEAPQLRRTDMGTGDWAIEARLENTSAAADAGYWAALEAVFDPFDQARFGISTDGGIKAFIQGLNEGSWVDGNAPVILRMEKHGEEYIFKYKYDPNEAWTVMAPISYGATPQYVGLITHAWETGSEEMHIDWSYFRLERWAAEQGLMVAPEMMVGRPEVEQDQMTPSIETTHTPTPTPALMRTMTPTRTGTPTATATPTPPAQGMGPALPPQADVPGLSAKFAPVSFNMLALNRISTPFQQSGPITITYDYDPLYRLKEANYSNGDYYHYSYDHVGNRLSQDTQVGGLLTTTTYLYDDANRLTDVNGVTYTWDNNGNLLDDGVNAYQYDSANRLKTLTGPSVNLSYSYNGLGDRLQETMNGNTTTFTMDLNAGLTQALSDGTHNYIYGVDRIAQTQAETTEYFLGDALGSVRQMADASAEVTYARAYDPYGVVSSTFGSSQSAYAFGGEYSGDYNELLYLRARFYASSTGRFLTRDIWEGDTNQPSSFNKWNYGYSNPILFLDPTGHVPCDSYDKGLAMAELYVSRRDHSGNLIKDEVNTYTAAGIAVQCYGLALDWLANESSGLGIAQITNYEVRTPYGEPIPCPTCTNPHENLGFGLLCYIFYKQVGNIENVPCSICQSRKELEKGLLPGQKFEDVYHLEPSHSQLVPGWAVTYLRRRIQQVVEQCKGKGIKCDDADRFIIAGLAQNGPGFGVGVMTDTIKTRYIDKITGEIKWRDWYTYGVTTPKSKKEYPKQLRLFYKYITMLKNDDYYLPPLLNLNDSDIQWLMMQ
jgi:RHS repeat-associated protein